MVGFSEELMFRGVFYNGMLTRLSIWQSILISSLVFGLIHSLNGFITGDFSSAISQSLQAILSGVWFMAIRLRTGSIIPAAIIHWLFDMSILFFVYTPEVLPKAESLSMTQSLFPVLLELLPFLFGLWLLKGIGKLNNTIEIGDKSKI